ncbi:unnamed protein product [Dicrocoelium dendriticum]|nr:unnamed protein product [Dicrocoelium dendriticum]
MCLTERMTCYFVSCDMARYNGVHADMTESGVVDYQLLLGCGLNCHRTALSGVQELDCSENANRIFSPLRQCHHARGLSLLHLTTKTNLVPRRTSTILLFRCLTVNRTEYWLLPLVNHWTPLVSEY